MANLLSETIFFFKVLYCMYSCFCCRYILFLSIVVIKYDYYRPYNDDDEQVNRHKRMILYIYILYIYIYE